MSEKHGRKKARFSFNQNGRARLRSL